MTECGNCLAAKERREGLPDEKTCEHEYPRTYFDEDEMILEKICKKCRHRIKRKLEYGSEWR